MNHHFRFFAFALVFVLISIQLASAWAPGTPDYLKCKPLPFYRFRADERHPAQFNRFAAVDPFVVRLIYFTPSDRPPRAEVPEELDTLIKQTQAFYASEMEARGYSQKSFIFEKDAAGKAIVHPVNGQFFDNHYLGDNTSDNVEAEIETQFSLEDNIYLVAVDVSDGFINNAGGVGGPRGPNGGVAVIPASGTNFDFTTVAHELGHAFGLQHDFRDDVYIMSYGDSPNRLSMCNADYLDVNRFFNLGRVFISEAEPTIRITSSLEYPPGASVIAIRFELNDPEGLHQAQFLPATTDFATGLDRAAAVGSPEVQECAGLNGQMEVIAFSYARFSGTDAHRLALGVVDLQGHTALKEFSVFSAGRIGQTLRVSQSGGTDFPSISTAVAQAFPRDLIEISDSTMYTERVEIKENLISIRALAGEQPLIEAFEIFGATGFTLENVNILDGVFVQNGAVVTIRDNTIESLQSGVLVTDASMAQIERNHIRNAQNGVRGVEIIKRPT